MIDLHGLASYIKIRNVVDEEISRTIGRPAHPGHIAEYVAAAIFDIKLMTNAAYKAIDGHFRSGALVDQSVNIKYGSRRDGTLNLVASLSPSDHPEHYLVLTGPDVRTMTSKGLNAPWVIRQVFLFAALDLVEIFAEKGVVPGVATSLKMDVWASGMIYPEQVNQRLVLSDEQRESLNLFWGADSPPGAKA